MTLVDENDLRTALGLSDLRFQAREEWGACFDGHRLAIRNALQKSLVENGADPVEVDEFQNLEKVPRSPFARVSISHCPKLGGFAWSRDANGLGLDIESSERISSQV